MTTSESWHQPPPITTSLSAHFAALELSALSDNPPQPPPHPTRHYSRDKVHIDPAHPFYPPSQRLIPHIVSTHKIFSPPAFSLEDAEFVESVQMNAPFHSCVCRTDERTHPELVSHWCCAGCRWGHFWIPRAERGDWGAVLGNYSFDVDSSRKEVYQMLKLIVNNMALGLFNFAQAHFQILKLSLEGRKVALVPTLFFADMAAAHRFAGHLAHACIAYRAHDSYLCSRYYHPTLAGDIAAMSRETADLAELQRAGNRMWSRLMMGYLGGGVGVGCVDLNTIGRNEVKGKMQNREIRGVRRSVRKDWALPAGEDRCIWTWVGVYLFGEDGKDSVFKVARVVNVPVRITVEETAGEGERMRKYVPNLMDTAWMENGAK